MTDVVSHPSDVGCSFNQGGVYAYEWFNDCATLQLTLRRPADDSCETRGATFDKLYFHREKCPTYFIERRHNTCELHAHGVYFAGYDSGEWTTMTFGERGYVQSISGSGNSFDFLIFF